MRSKYDLTLTVVRKQYNGRGLFGKGYCTLVTCTHYGVNSHRLLVRGRRVENRQEAESVRVTADAMQISRRSSRRCWPFRCCRFSWPSDSFPNAAADL